MEKRIFSPKESYDALVSAGVAKAALCPEDVPQFGEHAFDNILWYFSHNFRVIQGYYNEHLEKNFLRIDNYIEYKPEAAEKKQELDAKKDEDA